MNGEPNNVTVTVPARLHLGFLDLNGGLGRRFGSLGLAISGLRTRVTVSRGSRTHVRGPGSDRVQRYLARLQAFLDLGGAHDVRIDEAVPTHAGLGSGTQLALALAASLRTLHGMALDIRGDAVLLGRGRRSGVGIGLFDAGGVVVDGGCNDETRPAPLVSRLPFPEAWHILLVLDRSRSGVHGEEEAAAFARLPSFAAADSAKICRLVLMQALPALADGDFDSFCAAIKGMQNILGAYFAPLQGGHAFASRDVAATLALLESEGARGVGQSSWGPTGFAFARSRREAERLIDIARNDPRYAHLDISACKGLNRGAEIQADIAAVTPGQ